MRIFKIHIRKAIMKFIHRNFRARNSILLLIISDIILMSMMNRWYLKPNLRITRRILISKLTHIMRRQIIRIRILWSYNQWNRELVENAKKNSFQKISCTLIWKSAKIKSKILIESLTLKKHLLWLLLILW